MLPNLKIRSDSHRADTHSGARFSAGTIRWTDVPKVDDRPVAFVAAGSHGVWPTPGDHVYADVRGVCVFPLFDPSSTLCPSPVRFLPLLPSPSTLAPAPIPLCSPLAYASRVPSLTASPSSAGARCLQTHRRDGRQRPHLGYARPRRRIPVLDAQSPPIQDAARGELELAQLPGFVGQSRGEGLLVASGYSCLSGGSESGWVGLGHLPSLLHALRSQIYMV
jgi:hypothetical protein